MCQIRFQMSKNYMMYQKLFSSKGEAFFCACVFGTYNKFVGGKIDYFFCPEALALHLLELKSALNNIQGSSLN